MIIRQRKGFSIIEVLVVIAILVIVSAVVAPNIINWRRDVRLRGAINNLKGDFELARARAIRENGQVMINFKADRTGYLVFVDNGAGDEGIAEDRIRNGDELLFIDREMPSGVTIDLDQTSFGLFGDQTGFNGRGRCLAAGSAVMNNEKGESMRLTVGTLGQLTITKES